MTPAPLMILSKISELITLISARAEGTADRGANEGPPAVALHPPQRLRNGWG